MRAKAMNPSPPEKTLAVNRKALHDYEILERYEAGIVLRGSEVKAARAGRINLRDSFARVKAGEVYLLNCHISPYAAASTHETLDPTRERKLLLHKREILRLAGRVQEKGLTLVPLRVYLKGPYIKVELALARGRKVYQKREVARQRAIEREVQEELKRWR
ncbi:MAG: SsrA-binding protein SmpB [Acidobacteria bacterium]|nr:SsrA-binding protein SmpB [Acidobacteriota bacterium]MDW7983286.1 SsrA-binding protein SmpB [Acidobacteriota bacterium]